LEATLTRDRDRTNDIKRRIEAVRKKLEESGIKPETQKVLDEAPLYASTADLVQEAAQGIESDANKLRELKAAIPSINTESLQKAKAFPETSTFLEEVDIARATVATALDTALDAMMRLDGAQHIYAKDFERTFRGFKEKHADAVKLQANVSNLVEELQRLNSELQAGEAAERRSSSSLKSLERLPAEFNSARTFLDTKVAMLRELLSGAATQVMAMSGSILEALVQAEDIPQQYVSSLASLCEGSRIRDPESRCQGIVELLPKETQRQAWNAIANKILEIHRYKVQKQDVSAVDVSEEIRRELQFVFGELTAQQANTIYSRIDIPTVSEILTATVGAFVGFNYKDSSGLIPFKQASPGQQASALLHLLLHQQAGTLIIDQPEDDLDNRTIMGIVRLLQTTKQQRQLIFATHNPNFVVNGDADKVIALVPDSNDPGGIGQKRISIDADGAIETESVRIAITEVMEGGEAAFELRSRKYQFR
jgi:ABC-type cobalamin/Fe3+-siderophores transport system ATPase subunit